MGLCFGQEGFGDPHVAQFEGVFDPYDTDVLRIGTATCTEPKADGGLVCRHDSWQLDALNAAYARSDAVDISGCEIELTRETFRRDIGEADTSAVAVTGVGEIENDEAGDIRAGELRLSVDKHAP